MNYQLDSYSKDNPSALGYISAFSLYQEDVQNGPILSYNEKLDEILQNVIVRKSVVELTGHSGSGKTQLWQASDEQSNNGKRRVMKVLFWEYIEKYWFPHYLVFRFVIRRPKYLCISVQLPKFMGGVGGESLYISTNYNFSVERVREMARNFSQFYENIRSNNSIQFTEELILRNIHFVKVGDATELIGCLGQLGSFLLQKNIKLLVIDSISNPLRKLEVGNRLKLISKIFMDLKYLADKYDFAVVITNDMTTRVNGDVALTVPSFGDSFYHLVNSRIILSKCDTFFHAQLIKSLLMEPKEVNFQL